MAKLSIRDLKLKGKRVFIRVDFNVPLKRGIIGDDTRIRASLATIQYALDKGAAVLLASHLGRPKGTPNDELSLRHVAERLGQLLERPVEFASDCIGEPVVRAAERARASGGVVLLENLRFYAQEEQNDPDFAKALASEADFYVNDAFGAAHRAHASVEGITHFVPQAAAGLLMERELRYLGDTIESPERPLVAILGGAKVSEKIEVIDNLVKKVDTLIIGGAMAYTFLKSRDIPVGQSLVENHKLDAARRVSADAEARGVNLLLPLDHVVTDRTDGTGAHEVLRVGDPAIGSRIGVDIGPATIEVYSKAIRKAKTVFWNGPMGIFEVAAFAAGTQGVAEAVAGVKGTTIIGGGDSIAAIMNTGMAERITHISTGGGASLEFLGGRTLPGVAALSDRP